MTAHQFIEDWMIRHPEDCAQIAQAALRAYCVDSDMDTSKMFINLEKHPDLRDVDRLIVNAISNSSFKREVEMNGSLWAGFSGVP